MDCRLQERLLQTGLHQEYHHWPCCPVSDLDPTRLREGQGTCRIRLAMLSGFRPGSCRAALAEDGAYASWANLQLCQGLGIRPDIPLRTGPVSQGRGGDGRCMGHVGYGTTDGSLTVHIGGLSDDAKKENRRYWKSRVGCGRRWIVEIIIISAFKRLFGNSVRARKWENIVQEIKLKEAICNRYQEVLVMR